jgi:hypothetical protein
MPAKKTTPPWSLLIYVLGLVVIFFGFTDLTRVTSTSLPLFGGFLALLSVAVILAVHRGRPAA